MKRKNRFMAVGPIIFLIVVVLTALPGMAQKITGVPGSPSATTTISNRLPELQETQD